MNRHVVRNTAFAVLSHEWAGLVLAAVVIAAGIGLVDLLGTTGPSRALWTTTIVLLLLLGSAMALGACRHLVLSARVRRAHPPPGRMVDVGGYRLHVVAEGTSGPHPPIVWLPGGHAGAFALHHLHAALRDETRSILVDRPGTGWSDVGPFPRTTAREAGEIVLALERAGERGPFVFAGHSFGGLLAANIARRHPALVHTLVLLDATPLDTIVFGPRLAALTQIRTGALRAGWCALFGIDLRPRSERRMRSDPAMSRLSDLIDRELGEAGSALRAIEGSRAASRFAAASIFRELDPVGLADRAWETVVYDGDLGDLPVLVVAPQDQTDLGSLPEAATAAAPEQRRMSRFFGRNRERYMLVSSRTERVVAPAGTGHNFLYERPDFVVEVFRRIAHRAA